jgi:hypothetical protein
MYENWELSLDEEAKEKDNYKEKELYYWETKDGEYIKVDDLEERHLKNIVYKFGKDLLNNRGYRNIVIRFEKILKKGEI